MTLRAMYLPDIVRKVNSFLREKGFQAETPVERLMKYKDPIYKTFGVSQEGERVFLKVGLVGSGEDLKRLKREVSFWQALDKVDLTVWRKEKKIGLPAHLGSSLTRPFPWLLLERCQAKVTGNWFAFKKDFLTRENLVTLSHYFSFIQFLYQSLRQAGSFDFSDLPRRDGDWLRNSLARKKKTMTTVFGKKTYGLVADKVEEFKSLLDERCQFLLHRDSHPENILLAERGQLFLVDFNDICFGNEAYEFAHLWIHGWEKPSWQKAFLRKYLQRISDKERFLTLFKLSLFDLLTSEAENLSNRFMVSFRIPEEKIDSFQERAISHHARLLKLALADELI